MDSSEHLSGLAWGYQQYLPRRWRASNCFCSIQLSGICCHLQLDQMAWGYLHESQFEGARYVEASKSRNVRGLLLVGCKILINFGSPETMGGVCAAVYLLLMILFMPFLFYPDIKSAIIDDNNFHVKVEQVITGRLLHKFPLGKVILSFERRVES